MKQIFELSPSIKRLKHNAYYQGLVQNLFGGNESENICFLQFMYNTNILMSFNLEVANMFYDIAIDELKHQNILAEILIMLGGDPIYSNAQGKFISGRNIDYVKDIKQMINFAIEIKEKNIIEYKTAIAKIDDKEIKEKLEIILLDEKKHNNILKIYLKNLQ